MEMTETEKRHARLRKKSMRRNAIILSSPFALPDTFNFDFDAYTSVFDQYSFGQYAINSLITAGGSTIVSIVFYAMAAYVIAKFRFPERGDSSAKKDRST